MIKKYYFDIGSSTVKLYEYNKELIQIEEKSIMFKKNFTEKGVSSENIGELLNFIKNVKLKYDLSHNNTEIYSTGIWRKVPQNQLIEIEDEFSKLDLKFQVISHEQENDYFEKAMQGNYNKKRIMMVNMGGKTTEIVIFQMIKLKIK